MDWKKEKIGYVLPLINEKNIQVDYLNQWTKLQVTTEKLRLLNY